MSPGRASRPGRPARSERPRGSASSAAWEAHPHAVRLVGPALALPLVAGVVAYAVAAVPEGPARGWLRLGAVLAGLVAVALLVLLPVARWGSTRLVLGPTSVALRSGVLRPAERAVPLARVAEVTAVQTAPGRVLGHGTLVVVPVEGPELRVDDLPRVRRVQRMLLERAEAAGAGTPDEDDEDHQDDQDDEDPRPGGTTGARAGRGPAARPRPLVTGT